MADSQRKSYNLFDKSQISSIQTPIGDRYGSIFEGAVGTYTLDVTGTVNSGDYLYADKVLSDGSSGARYYIVNNGTKTTTQLTVQNDGEKFLIYNASGDNLAASQAKFDRWLIMLNSGNTAKPYEPYGWVHSLRKMSTATEAVENPLYSDGTALTVRTIKGNTVQSGTPTPSNPVTVQGVGERTENLFDVNGTYSLKSGSVSVTDDSITATLSGDSTQRIYYDKTYSAGTYKISFSAQNVEGRLYSDKEFTGSTYNSFYGGYYRAITGAQTITFAEDFIIGFILAGPSGANAVISNIMFQTNTSTADYEPYGYKIPISNGQQTTNIYLNNPLYKIGDYADTISADGTVTRRIAKWVFNGTESWYNASTFTPPFFYITGLTPLAKANSSNYFTNLNAIITATGDLVRVYDYDYFNQDLDTFKAYLVNQYANGTPETIYYILATPTTEQITLPSIPTTEGVNSITVDTTVQPSEFTATWAGWHDSSVKEYDGTDWQ